MPVSPMVAWPSSLTDGTVSLETPLTDKGMSAQDLLQVNEIIDSCKKVGQLQEPIREALLCPDPLGKGFLSPSMSACALTE